MGSNEQAYRRSANQARAARPMVPRTGGRVQGALA